MLKCKMTNVAMVEAMPDGFEVGAKCFRLLTWVVPASEDCSQDLPEYEFSVAEVEMQEYEPASIENGPCADLGVGEFKVVESGLGNCRSIEDMIACFDADLFRQTGCAPEESYFRVDR